MLKNCTLCNKPSSRPTHIDGKEICSRCFYTKYCYFCAPPVVLEACKGHSIIGNTSENRFMSDPEFVQGIQFEMESESNGRK